MYFVPPLKLSNPTGFLGEPQSQDVASYVHWTLEERYQRIERVS